MSNSSFVRGTMPCLILANSDRHSTAPFSTTCRRLHAHVVLFLPPFLSVAVSIFKISTATDKKL